MSLLPSDKKPEEIALKIEKITTTLGGKEKICLDFGRIASLNSRREVSVN